MTHHPKKSLGQHFLTSRGALDKIVNAARITPGDVVLEVGPGRGVLTKHLLASGAKVVAVEKDDTLVDILNQELATEISAGNLQIISQDILDFNPTDHASLAKYKIVANIPYYLTGQFFRQFLSSSHPPEVLVVLIQKEVAERIIARDGKESILSISVKAYGEPSYIGTVKAGSFNPPPKIDSAILKVDQISRAIFDEIDEKIFFDILKQGFGQKRKQLKSNLDVTEDVFINCHLEPKTRAEDLNLKDWLCLTKQITQNL